MATRIQLCGPVVATIDDRRIERALSGRQGRLLFAYLVTHRLRASSDDELIDAVWPEEPPRAVDAAVDARFLATTPGSTSRRRRPRFIAPSGRRPVRTGPVPG